MAEPTGYKITLTGPGLQLTIWLRDADDFEITERFLHRVKTIVMEETAPPLPEAKLPTHDYMAMHIHPSKPEGE
jgi:hypothetical protein